MKLAHARAFSICLFVWWACLLWLWPRAVRAETLSVELRLYDWASVGYAAGLGLLGGALALIVALASDRRVVMQVLSEGGRNAIISPIAGAGAYMALKACAALGWFTVSTEPRFLVIVVAGYAGTAAIQWAGETASKVAGALRERLVNFTKG